MYELLIIRHAVAHERDASAWPNDEERPLTEAGIEKFRQAARGLARVLDAPEELLCSPLTRTRQTAAILEEKAGFPRAIELDMLRPDTETATLVRALQERQRARIAVVGHEPSLSELICALLAGLDARAEVEMKKGAVAQLAFADRIEAGRGQLLQLLPPRVLRALARKG
jgi:phosphohistidine phosphatase